MDLAVFFNIGAADFRTFGVQHQTDPLAGDLHGFVGFLKPAELFLVIAVGEVETENIRASLDQLHHNVRSIGGRTDRGNDFSSTHCLLTLQN